MTPGDTIKKERERRGWSQSTLAEQAALPTSSINRYERNKRALTLEATHVLASVLSEDVDGYRRLSATLVKSTCEHFGTSRRKHSPLESVKPQTEQKNAPADDDGCSGQSTES